MPGFLALSILRVGKGIVGLHGAAAARLVRFALRRVAVPAWLELDVEGLRVRPRGWSVEFWGQSGGAAIIRLVQSNGH